MSAPPSRLSVALVVLLWVAVALGVVVQILGSSSPDETTAVIEDVLSGLSRGGLFVAVVLAIGLLAWPPVLPWLRLGWRTWREQSSVDPRPLLEARARLAHFENAADHYVVGRSLARMGSSKAAWPHLSRSLELDRHSAATWFEAGKVANRLGDLAAARRCFAEALVLDPRHGFGEARLLLAQLHFDVGDAAAAEAELITHEQLHGTSRQGDLLRARALQALGRSDEAKDALTRARLPLPPGARTPLTERLARARALVYRLRRSR
ncbi:MAG: tetratricopeptide repeat protein [Planctomycetota bacterium]